MSKFSIYSSVKSQQAQDCSYERFNEAGSSPIVINLCKAIAAEEDHDRRSALKKQLPIITFQARFDGPRKNALAHPSGFYIFDGDGIDDPHSFYIANVARRLEELEILYAGMTPSCHGIRLVARMRSEFSSIADAQKWLGTQIGWECDPQCKDLARASYVVPHSYVYYLNRALFEDDKEASPCVIARSEAQRSDAAIHTYGGNCLSDDVWIASSPAAPRNDESFKGIPLTTIAHEWLLQTGGEPAEGERNDRLHKLALRLRHITDYNEQTLLKVMPRYGLSEGERN